MLQQASGAKGGTAEEAGPYTVRDTSRNAAPLAPRVTTMCGLVSLCGDCGLF